MKKTGFGLLMLFLLLLSCTPKKDVAETDIPPGILPPDSMTAIITEMQYTEAILREFKRRGQHSEERAAVFYSQTFEKHGITPERYKKSLEFYEKHQDAYYEIYTDVVSRLTELQTEVDNQLKK